MDQSTLSGARQTLANQLQELADIVDQASAGGVDTAFESMRRWKARTVDLLNAEVHPDEAERFTQKKPGSFRRRQPFANLHNEAGLYAGSLCALDQELAAHPESVLRQPQPSAPAPNASAQPLAGNHVFIVHGHDEVNRHRLMDLLEDRWDLQPIIMSGEPGSGRTLIEKFEQEAERVSFAFVLITPDDFIQSATRICASSP